MRNWLDVRCGLFVQMWDTRVPSRRLQRFSAHYGPVFSIDWHPTEHWLATGGRDKMIRVSFIFYFILFQSFDIS